MQRKETEDGQPEAADASNIVHLVQWRQHRSANAHNAQDRPLDGNLDLHRLREAGRAYEEMSRLSRMNGEAMLGVADRMDEAMQLLMSAASSGRRLVADLDVVIAHAGRTSAFNAECQRVLELAEGIDGAEQLAAIEALRDTLALKLGNLIKRG